MTATPDESYTSGHWAARLAGALVLLYPRAWRERYGGELLDLLRSKPLSIAAVVATLRGALDAHANLPHLMSSRTTRLRWSIITTFAAWVALCLAAIAVAKSMEAPGFARAAQTHTSLGVLATVGTLTFTLAALAIGIAAVPLAVAATRQASRRRDRVTLGLLALPVAVAGILVGLGVLLGRVHPGPVHSLGTIALALGCLALLVMGAVASVRSVAAVLHRTDVAPRSLRLAGLATVVSAAAMSTGVLAGVGYGLAVRLETPRLFFSSNGVLATPLSYTWLPALLLAVGAVLVADRAAWCALRSVRAAR